MARKPGSGHVRYTTAAIEEMVAAVFAGERNVRPLVRRIDVECDRGRCGVPGALVERWLRALADEVALDVVSAESPSPDLLGDVRLTLSGGTDVWIEVKAQTSKRFGDLLQADWVRDETDALRWLGRHEPQVKRLLSPWIRDALDIYDPEFQFGELAFPHLWLADIALLHDRPRRAIAGVKTPQDLMSFLGRKYFLHLTTDGARMVRLDRLPCVERVMAGEPVHLDVAAGGSCDARIWVSGRGAPTRGAIDFVYYVGYQSLGVVGRHKLHPSAISAADDVVTVG